MADQAPTEQQQDAVAAPAAATPAAEKKPHCGIIMPISDSAGYDPGHWLEVRRLIVRAAEQVGYTAGMVSENDGQDVIHRSIVKNIYHNELVVCDVSSLNPNVMLELGLRMANKKPLIVIFDGEGVYPFDIKNMLYIPYPKGLHHFKVENFVQELTARIVQVTEAAKNNKYEPFLNHYNDVVIEESKLGTTTKGLEETLLSLVEEFKSIKSEIKLNSSNREGFSEFSDNNISVIFTKTEVSYINHITKITYATINNKNLDFASMVRLVYNECVRLAEHPYSGYTDPNLRNKLVHYQDTVRSIIKLALSQVSASEGRQA